MRFILCLFTAWLLSTSCATMLNRSHTRVTILSDKPDFRLVYGDDTIATKGREMEMLVPRSKEPLALQYVLGRGFVDTLIPARMSGTICLNYYNAFLGLIVDRKHAKGYAYPKVRLYKTYRKGDCLLSPAIWFSTLFNTTLRSGTGSPSAVF